MQTGDLRDRDGSSELAWHDRTWVGAILVERKMSTGALVIVDVRGEDAAQRGRSLKITMWSRHSRRIENRDGGTHELKHAGDTTAVRHKTLDFSGHSEFLVATGS
jgi:hypothetical protein